MDHNIADSGAQIAEDEEAFDWDQFLAEEAELYASGEKPVFSSGDYPTEEAAMEALGLYMHKILKEVLGEIATENRTNIVGA